MHTQVPLKGRCTTIGHFTPRFTSDSFQALSLHGRVFNNVILKDSKNLCDSNTKDICVGYWESYQVYAPDNIHLIMTPNTQLKDVVSVAHRRGFYYLSRSHY